MTHNSILMFENVARVSRKAAVFPAGLLFRDPPISPCGLSSGLSTRIEMMNNVFSIRIWGCRPGELHTRFSAVQGKGHVVIVRIDTLTLLM